MLFKLLSMYINKYIYVCIASGGVLYLDLLHIQNTILTAKKKEICHLKLNFRGEDWDWALWRKTESISIKLMMHSYMHTSKVGDDEINGYKIINTKKKKFCVIFFYT
jgi:hypothetical protein